MTGNEINILNQELCVLLSLDFDATRHGLEISSLILKCILKDEAEETVSTTKFGCGQAGAGAHGLGWSGGFRKEYDGTCSQVTHA